MSDRVIGTCGSCGGPVVVPFVWHGVVPPVPACSQCGSQVKQGYGPVLPMEDTNPSSDMDLLLERTVYNIVSGKYG